MREKKLDSYYILFRGNQGFGGINQLVHNLKNEKDVYFVVSDYIEFSGENNQLCADIHKMIYDNYQLVSKLNYFSIYYKE